MVDGGHRILRPRLGCWDEKEEVVIEGQKTLQVHVSVMLVVLHCVRDLVHASCADVVQLNILDSTAMAINSQQCLPPRFPGILAPFKLIKCL